MWGKKVPSSIFGSNDKLYHYCARQYWYADLICVDLDNNFHQRLLISPRKGIFHGLEFTDKYVNVSCKPSLCLLLCQPACSQGRPHKDCRRYLHTAVVHDFAYSAATECYAHVMPDNRAAARTGPLSPRPPFHLRSHHVHTRSNATCRQWMLNVLYPEERFTVAVMAWVGAWAVRSR